MLKFVNISKSYGRIEVLHNINFEVREGRITALIGANGAGKSTLMKILSGSVLDHSGAIELDGRTLRFNSVRDAVNAGVSIVHQELNIIPDLTVGENLFLGREPLTKLGLIDYKKLNGEASNILAEFDFPFSPDTKAGKLGVGWQQVLEIARALAVESKIIILDEPTSALSSSEIKILFDKMNRLKEKGIIIFFITHRLQEVFEAADDVVVLRDGCFISEYIVQNAEREVLINDMIGKAISPVRKREPIYSNENILKLDKVTVYKQNKAILHSISFEIKPGEIFGLSGLMGSGKFELLKFIFGDSVDRWEGDLYLFGNKYNPSSASRSVKNKVFYLSSSRKDEGILPDQSILHNSSISALKEFSTNTIIDNKSESSAVLKMNEKLNIHFSSLFQEASTLSGGNQQKVLLGRALLINPKLLLLGEPTRGIDVGAKEEIYYQLRKISQNGISIIISSSDVNELLDNCGRVTVLSQGRQTGVFSTAETTSEEILRHSFKEVS